MRVMSIMPLIRNLPIGEMVQFNPEDESYARGGVQGDRRQNGPDL